jgi:hypothetical protein
MNTNRLSKTLVIGIIVLLIFASLPLVSGDNNLYSINKEVRNFENDIPPSPEGMYENLLIKARGPYLFDILMVILTGEPVPFLETLITNFDDETVTIERHFKLVATRGNRVLDEFDMPTKKLIPGWCSVIFLFDQFEWKKWDYSFGLFDYFLELHVQETNSDITVVFHGFVFGIGAIIFNPDGELVE